MTNEEIRDIEYKKQIRERDEIIDNLFIAFQKVKNNQYADIMPLLDRVIRERNELSIQRAETQFRFNELVSDNEECREITKHFK